MEEEEEGPSYYAYYDQENETYYYFNNQTKETCWIYPTDGDVLDPRTGDIFPDPDKAEPEPSGRRSSYDSSDINSVSNSSKMNRSTVAWAPRPRFSTLILNCGSSSTFKVSIPEEVLRYDPKYHRAQEAGQVITNDSESKDDSGGTSEENSTDPNLSAKPRIFSYDQKFPRKQQKSINLSSNSNYMDTKIRESASGGIALQDFAREHFKKAHRGFSRQSVSMDTLTSYEKECISEPLLSNLPDSLQKSAIHMFKQILEYTGANGKQRNDNASVELVRTVLKDDRVIDECYFQLIKQTNGNPHKDILGYTWELFCIIATIFPCSKDVEVWIQAHIASSISNEDTKIRLLCTFTYIRFTSRCSTGETMQNVTDAYIKEIPIHYRTTNLTFGVSLYELMWGQRRIMPQCPLPYFLVQIIRALIDAGAFTREGIFHITGNIKIVDELERAINMGDVVLDTADVDDLASLLKRFFRELVGRVVPQSEIGYMAQSIKDGTAIDFAANLPPVKSITLAYLVGFLQELVQHQDKTHMSLKKLAALWAPNIMQEDLKNPNNIIVSEKFLETLITNWDVSDVYPYKGQLL